MAQSSQETLAQYNQESIIRYNGTVQSGYFGTIQSGIYNKVLWHNAVRIFWHNTIKSFEPMVRCFGTEFSSDFKIRFFAQFSQEFIKRNIGTIQQKSIIWFLGTF